MGKQFVVRESFVAMSDGIRLYTRIVTPAEQGTFPIVFIRTPYEKAGNRESYPIDKDRDGCYLKHGYAVVIQHCRGTGDSEGICIPYQERKDGLETLAYLRTLPFYNGEIFLAGSSYLATVHLSYLAEAPSDVKGAALNVQTDRMYFRNYRNGCNYSFNNLDWWLGMLKRQYPSPDLEGTIRRPYKELMQRIVGEDVPAYTEGLLHDTYDAFWEEDSRTFCMEKLQIPVLLTEGWYDFYVEGMFSMWERMNPKLKQKSAFIVGPWGHGTRVANAEYPLPHGHIPDDYMVQWFDSIRSGEPYAYATCGKVNYYSIGGDYWTDSDYPLENRGCLRYYFWPDSGLKLQKSMEPASMTFTYDPENRTVHFPYQNIYKAQPVNSTNGVLSFCTEELAEETDFFGRVRWHMPVSSDCGDTAFFIRIYFTENGESYNLTETITSLSYICENYEPGSVVTIDLMTPPIAFTLKPGTGLRVDIASDGDIYVPHANVKGHWAKVTESRVAHNTVYLQEAFIELPQSMERRLTIRSQ